MYPKNDYKNLIDSKLENIDLKNFKIFNYNPDPKILTVKLKN